MKRLIIILIASLYVLPIHAQMFGNDKPKPFDVQMKALTKQMIKNFSDEGKKQIAIMEFMDMNGKVTKLGKLIPEELTTRLFKSGQFQVIERQLLNKVIEEQKLGMSGIIDASSAAEIGKLLGVDAIVTGTVTDRGDGIRVNARMIETENAQVFAVASASIVREAYLLAMLDSKVDIPEESVSSTSNASDSKSNDKNSEHKIIARGLVNDIKVEVVSIDFNTPSEAKLTLVFTNKNKNDAEVNFYPRYKTSLYDNLGQEYFGDKIAIGSKTAYGSGNLDHRLISGIPTTVTYFYKDIDLNAKTFSLFSVNLRINREDHTVEFRKLKFER